MEYAVMVPGKDHARVRAGNVQIGDLVQIPAIGTYIEIDRESIFLGSLVETHTSVFRLAEKIRTPSFFNSDSERLDHLQDHDYVQLIAKSGTGYPLHRAVGYKDREFVYLRNPQGMVSEGHVNKVCRRTGKVWAWSATGWDPIEYVVRTESETSGSLRVDQALDLASAFYGD
jgi:hypothetical protein